MTSDKLNPKKTIAIPTSIGEPGSWPKKEEWQLNRRSGSDKTRETQSTKVPASADGKSKVGPSKAGSRGRRKKGRKHHQTQKMTVPQGELHKMQ